MRVIPKTLQVLTTLAFCLTTAAFAQEGSTIKMISQGSVMNAGGFPFKIAKPGSYRLASNLTVPANVDAIDISADNVNLDLNGFTIAGPVTCTGGPPVTSCSGATSGVGVSSSSDNTSVRNGSIVGMGGNGVTLDGAGEVVEDVHTKFNNGYGIDVQRGAVRHSSAVSNLTGGIAVFLASVEGNSVLYNGGLGLNVNFGTVITNISAQNQTGLLANRAVYGSNSFSGNSLKNVVDGGGSTSQNNNNCDGTTC